MNSALLKRVHLEQELLVSDSSWSCAYLQSVHKMIHAFWKDVVFHLAADRITCSDSLMPSLFQYTNVSTPYFACNFSRVGWNFRNWGHCCWTHQCNQLCFTFSDCIRTKSPVCHLSQVLRLGVQRFRSACANYYFEETCGLTSDLRTNLGIGLMIHINL